jgi:iron complex outermembrane receptor protein
MNNGSRVVGAGSGNRYPLYGDERFYQTARCVLPAPVAGVADVAGTCGSDYEYRINPRHRQYPHEQPLHPGRRAGADG